MSERKRSKPLLILDMHVVVVELSDGRQQFEQSLVLHA